MDEDLLQLSLNEYDDEVQPDDIEPFVERHPFVRNRLLLNSAVEKPRFGIRLRDIKIRSSLIPFLRDAIYATNTDVKFYNEKVADTLQTLRELRDKPSRIVQDVLIAAFRPALPPEIRHLLCTILETKVEKFGYQIKIVFNQIEEEHAAHKDELGFVMDAMHKVLQNVSSAAQNYQSDVEENSFELRNTITEYFKTTRGLIDRYMRSNSVFIEKIILAYNDLEQNVVTLIRVIRQLKARLMANWLTCYDCRNIFPQLRKARDFAVETKRQIFQQEGDLIIALTQIRHLCVTLTDY